MFFNHGLSRTGFANARPGRARTPAAPHIATSGRACAPRTLHWLVAVCTFFALALTSFGAEPGITVSAKQRYPWNGLVDLHFTITGTAGTKYDTSFTAKNMVGNTNIAMRTIRKADGAAAATKEQLLPGTYSWVWDAAADLPDGFQCERVAVTATADSDPHDNVQLWKDGPYWATTNIGAENPEDSGYYFWWGDTVGYKREGDAWVATDGSSSNFSFNTSNTPTIDQSIATLQSEGWVFEESDTYILAPEHDAAQMQWGDGWRMPTKQEFDDLNSKCDWMWTTTQSGVNGYIVSGRGDYAANSIFLPSAGYGLANFLLASSAGNYWSSVPYSDNGNSWHLSFYSSSHYTSDHSNGRHDGFSVRPVSKFTYTIRFNANGGTGMMADLSMIYGMAKNLTTNGFTRAGYAFAGWATNATDSVAAYGDGERMRNLTTTQGATVTLYAKWLSLSPVQLWDGGPCWAATNIGAEKPEGYGYHFWWGDTVGYRYEDDVWVANDGSSSHFSFNTSNTPTDNKSIATLQSEGWVFEESDTYILAPEHDAAQVQWGGGWRMPTYQELYDLCYNKCDWTSTRVNGVYGWIVRGRDAYDNNCIFLPSAGVSNETSLQYSNWYGYYWSSVPSGQRYSCELMFNLVTPSTQNNGGRYGGRSVRPVRSTQ